MTTATVTLADLVAVTAGRAQHVIEQDRNYVLFWPVPNVKPTRVGMKRYYLHACLAMHYIPEQGYIAELSESWDQFTGNTHVTLAASFGNPHLDAPVLALPATRFQFAKWTEFVRDARKAVRTLETS